MKASTKIRIFKYLPYTFFALPFIASAQGPQNLMQLIEFITGFINPIIGLISGLAFIFFLWGVTKYIISAGDEAKKKEGKNVMLYGIIGLFVIFSIWGILTILINTFFGTGAPPAPPGPGPEFA